MEKIRDTAIGLLVLAAVFVISQGGVGYLGLPRKSLWYWVVPICAVLVVVTWYFRASRDDDWRAPAAPADEPSPRDDDRTAGGLR